MHIMYLYVLIGQLKTKLIIYHILINNCILLDVSFKYTIDKYSVYYHFIIKHRYLTLIVKVFK